MSDSKQKQEELINTIDYKLKKKNWMESAVEFKQGNFNYSGITKNVEYLKLSNQRKCQPTDPDWKLPENWQQIILEGLRERLDKYR